MALLVDEKNVVKQQADRINFLEGENTRLRKQNFILQNALIGQTLESKKSYRQMQDRFDQLSRLILKTIVDLIRIRRRPVSYDEVIKAFRIRYPQINAKAETITRRIRQLAEDKYCRERLGANHALLHSPERGTFVPIPQEGVSET